MQSSEKTTARRPVWQLPPEGGSGGSFIIHCKAFKESAPMFKFLRKKSVPALYCNVPQYSQAAAFPTTICCLFSAPHEQHFQTCSS